MWELDYKESWALKNWCFWTVGLEKTLESPLDCKEIKSVHPKGNQSWIFIGRTDAEAETPILWPPDLKNWLIGKDPGCWEGLKAGGEADNIGWDGWMASLTRWTWVWTSSGSWWWTWEPGVLQSMDGRESDMTEHLNRTELSDVCSVVQLCTTVWPHGLDTARLLCPWSYPDKNTVVGCHFLLQGISLIQGLNPHILCLLHC